MVASAVSKWLKAHLSSIQVDGLYFTAEVSEDPDNVGDESGLVTSIIVRGSQPDLDDISGELTPDGQFNSTQLSTLEEKLVEALLEDAALSSKLQIVAGQSGSVVITTSTVTSTLTTRTKTSTTITNTTTSRTAYDISDEPSRSHVSYSSRFLLLCLIDGRDLVSVRGERGVS